MCIRDSLRSDRIERKNHCPLLNDRNLDFSQIPCHLLISGKCNLLCGAAALVADRHGVRPLRHGQKHIICYFTNYAVSDINPAVHKIILILQAQIAVPLLDMKPVNHIFVAPHTELVHRAYLHHVRLPAARCDDDMAADVVELIAERNRSFAQIHTVSAHIMIADAVRVLPDICQCLARLVKAHGDDASLF